MKKTYFSKLLNLTRDDFPDVIKEICEETKLDDIIYSISLDSCGIDYVLEKISADIFLTTNPINRKIRHKLILFYTIIQVKEHFSNIFEVNDKLKREKDSWYITRLLKEKEILIQKIKVKIPVYLMNSFIKDFG